MRSLYKRGKFGMLPGEVSRRTKIRMLEDDEEFFVFPWQLVTLPQIRSYRNKVYKKLNRRFRRGNNVMSVRGGFEL